MEDVHPVEILAKNTVVLIALQDAKVIVKMNAIIHARMDAPTDVDILVHHLVQSNAGMDLELMQTIICFNYQREFI